MKTNKRMMISLIVAGVLAISGAIPSLAASGETVITLSDSGIKVNGVAASASAGSAVYTGAEIVYYEAGHDSSYGEGTTADGHTVTEAKAHTVVTITKAGTYRLSGKLSAGQVAVDLGGDASKDPNAVVTLILDGVDITCKVAPAVIFYNVYECGVVDTKTASATVDTSKAGANVILADGTTNHIDGSYVARIYEEGTTKKLHKYDGAFYSKMSMNVSGGTSGTGVLNITAANEGMDSELHLTINGGVINITAENDGINTNEDGVSVTTINGGTLTVNGGFGIEGDGIDSNGYLVINGGTIYATANPRTGDGGIDADMDILINGGTVVASGTRNDAVGTTSKQLYMELSFASTQKAGTVIRITDAKGSELFSYAPTRDFQSFTISLPKLALDTNYSVYANGVQQQYSGTGTGFGPGRGGQMGTAPADMTSPGGVENRLPRQLPEGIASAGGIENRTPGQPPEGFDPNAAGGFRGMGGQAAAPGEGTIEFILTATSRSFSGISDSIEGTGKTAVAFAINNGVGIQSVSSGQRPVLSDVQVLAKSDQAAVNIPQNDIQITVTDVPSENFSETCLLSGGASAIADILPEDDGTYQLTITVLGSNETYAGTNQWLFKVGGLPFVDINENHTYYKAIEFVYENGLMSGTGNNQFSANQNVSRGMTVTVLGHLADAQTVEGAAFADVAAGSWYAPYVGWAEQNDIVKGYGNGKFGPEDAVTRQQMCVMIANYAASSGITLQSGTLNYTDASDIADWAKEAVALCAASGLLDHVAPAGAVLKPDTVLTRAELADILMLLAALS